MNQGLSLIVIVNQGPSVVWCWKVRISFALKIAIGKLNEVVSQFGMHQITRVDNWVDNRVDDQADNQADNQVDNPADNQMQKK